MTEGARIRRPGGRTRFGVFAVLALALLALAGAGALLVLARGEMRVPGWAVAQAVELLNRRLAMAGQLQVGSATVDLSDGLAAPRLLAGDVALTDRQGTPRLTLPEVDVTLSGGALMRGALVPRSVAVSGARLLLARDAEGRLSLMLSDAGAFRITSLDQALDLADRALAGPMLRDLETITVTGVGLIVEDAMTDRRWQFEDGRVTLDSRGAGLRAELALSLPQAGAAAANARLSVTRTEGAADTALWLRFDGITARDLAAQAPALAWLARVETRLAGTLSLDLGPEGGIAALDGTVEAGPGRVALPDLPGPVRLRERFEAASARFRFDATADRLQLDRLVLRSPDLTVELGGHLGPLRGEPDTPVLAQLSLRRLRLAPEGLFAAPVEMTEGALDLRLRRDPLRLDIGQMVLGDGATTLQLSGHAEKAEAGWRAALDAEIPEIHYPKLMALWPLVLKVKTREWLVENITAARITGVRAALRAEPGQEKPPIHMTFGFDGLAGTYMRSMPPITGGRGYGALGDNVFDIVLHEGRTRVPGAPVMSLAGSALHVPEADIKGGPGEIDLRLAGPLAGALALLEHEPFRFLSKGGVPLDVARGAAQAEAWLRLPLRKGITFDDVQWRAEGTIADVVSDTLVPGKRLTADSLRLNADRDGLAIGGEARLGRARLDGSWRQRFGPEHKGSSTISGTVDLDPAFLAEFGVALPEGMFSGAGHGRLEVDLERGAPPVFRLASDLNGVRLALAGLGWLKRPDMRGRFELRGRLTRPVRVDSLALEAAGLSLLGSVDIAEGGVFERLRLEHLRIGDWLDVAADVQGAGPEAPPRIALRGGTLDLRGARFGNGGAAGGAAADGPPITVTLDRLVVTENIALTGVEGDLRQDPRLAGDLRARVNGGPPVALALAPAEHGTAITLTGEDAGAVLAAAGLLRNAEGGALDLALVPEPEPRSYDATLGITNTRVRDAPLLAELLSAISVVGLLDQLAGGGIVFTSVDARLSLGPDVLTVARASATGPSMGLTAEGYFDLANRRLDLQGVVTPIYMINGILEQTKIFGNLFGRRTGEGVFGFNYRMQGPADNASVSVNPLSVLAPGILREIFRGSAPEPPTQ